MTTLHQHVPGFRARAMAWLPVILLILAATWIRYSSISSGNYLLIGGDGPYYPLQVRSLLEHHRLAYPDMPLLFFLQAIVASILNFFDVASYNECIIAAVKATDVVLPPLAAIPVFLIAKELRQPDSKPGFLNYLVVAFALINFSTTGAFSNGLQKNAVAIIWIFFYLYYLIRLIRHERKKDAVYAGLVLFLCAITHFGSCALLLFISAVTGFSWLLYKRKTLRRLNRKNSALIVTGILLLLAIIAFYDTGRFQRLMAIPLRIFEFPVLLLMLKGFGIENFLSPVHLLLTNFMALTGIILLVANRKKIDSTEKLIATAMIIVALFLATPFMGLEWANRLYIMSYIPIVILYLILFRDNISKWAKALPATIFAFFVLICSVPRPGNADCISTESYTELTGIKTQVNFEETDVIIGRQDLRILGSWEFRTKSVVDYLFKKEDFENYHAVYVIRQIKGSNFLPGRFRGDARIPDNADKVYAGTCFELYRLRSADGWKGGKGKASRAHGKIVHITPRYLILQNDQGFLRTIELTEHTSLETPLRIGIPVEVWGSWKPFSLDVVAETIRELH